MSRSYERDVQRAQAVQIAVGAQEERTTPRTRAEIESFVKGFGMSAAAARRIVDEWEADQQQARDAGWESHANSVWYDS